MEKVNDYEFCIDYIGVRVDCPNVIEFERHLRKGLLRSNDMMLPGKPLRFYQSAARLNGTRIFSYEYSLLSDIDPVEGGKCDTGSLWMDGSNGAFGIFCEFSGDGIRYFGINKIISFLGELRTLYNLHFTRVDLAMDVFDGSNTIIPTVLLAAENKLSCSSEGVKIYKARKAKMYFNQNPYRNCKSVSCEIGTRGGNFVRCYDKWLEQREKPYITCDADIPHEYWYRLEVEVRPGAHVDGIAREYPDEVFENVFKGVNLSEIYLRHLTRVFVIREVRYTYDSHADDTLHCLVWDEFVEMLENANFTQSGAYKEYLQYYDKKTAQQKLDIYKNFLFTLLICNKPDYVLALFEEYRLGIMNKNPKLQKYRNQAFGDVPSDKINVFNPFGILDHKLNIKRYRNVSSQAIEPDPLRTAR